MSKWSNLKTKEFLESITNSYSQIFFSSQYLFALLLLAITFIDLPSGILGLYSVLIISVLSFAFGLPSYKVKQGYYGFNGLLVGLALGTYYEFGLLLFLLTTIAVIFSLLISVAMEGVIGKYNLPKLSLPFVFTLFFLLLAAREFHFLGLSERGVYILNDWYAIGGKQMVAVISFFNELTMPFHLNAYFSSLSSILFQYNLIAGILIAIGLLLYSRVAFVLSLYGFYIAIGFYYLLGISVNDIIFSYAGFNYILTAIAIGGFFIIPSLASYISLLFLIPVAVLINVGASIMFAPYQLPIYSLPFNFVVLLFLYFLQFREHNRIKLSSIFLQYNQPENNYYAYTNNAERFAGNSPIPIYLPFHGEWVVTQGHDGEYTHKDGWKHAWDFEINNEEGKTFQNKGDYAEDYYCFDKTLLAPADAIIEQVEDGIDDNIVGNKNLDKNWGNTIVLKHTEGLYSKLSHLRKDSIQVKIGDKVRKGQVIARCGNSGNSPYPHLHFQFQSTPYIGDKTILYPISNCIIKREDILKMMPVCLPRINDRVSGIKANDSLKKAFQFIIGSHLEWNIKGMNTTIEHWEFCKDYYLNTYIYCETTNSKAYYRADDSFFYFTHFEGTKKTLLHYFYMAAFRVCLDNRDGLVIKDVLPINKYYSGLKLLAQDFMLPFIQLFKASYLLSYETSKNSFLNEDMVLKGVIEENMLWTKKETIFFEMHIEKNQLTSLTINTIDEQFIASVIC